MLKLLQKMNPDVGFVARGKQAWNPGTSEIVINVKVGFLQFCSGLGCYLSIQKKSNGWAVFPL